MPATKERREAHSEVEESPLLQEDIQPRGRDDALRRRLALGLGISVAANAVIWTVASGVVHSHLRTPPQPITIERIVLPPRQKIVRPKPPKPKPVVKPPKPKPIVKPPPPKPVVVHHAPPPPPQHHAPPPPPAHNRVLVGHGPAVPGEHGALPGGNAAPGRPVEHQYPGNGRNTEAKPAPPPPPPPPRPAPEEPKPAPPPPPPPPPPAGPTRDAQADHLVMPQIPDDLLQQSFKTHVLVRVIVHADGTGIPSLVTSSGNLEVDQLVLQALKQSTWKPALDSGKPIESSFRFRYEFSVQ